MLRKWVDLPNAERNELLEFYEKDKELINDDVVGQYQLSMKATSLRSKLRVWREMSNSLRSETVNSVKIQASPSRTFLDYEVLEGDDYIIASDFELPDHMPVYLERLILVGMAHGIRRLIIAGDYIATDQASLNEWVTLWKTDDLSYEESIDLAKGILSRLSSWFTEIVIIEGNHDDRISRATKGEVHLGMFLANDKVRYSRYSFLWIKTSKGYVYVCHPRQYSAASAGLGQRIYNKLVAPDGSKPVGLILGHTHQAQTGVSADNICWIVALGTLRDRTRTKYVATSANTHNQWENGFLMLRKSFAYPLTSRSDWAFWLGDYYPNHQKELTHA